MIPETVGLGAVALALIGLMTKVWLDSQKHTDSITDVVEKNAIAMTELKNTIKENIHLTRETKALIQKINGFKK